MFYLCFFLKAIFLVFLGAHFGKPYFKRFCVGRGDRLNKTKYALCIKDIGLTHFAVGGKQFQPLTKCKEFTSLFF